MKEFGPRAPEYANCFGRRRKRETEFGYRENWSGRVWESRGSAWSPSEVHGIPRKEWESLGRAWDSSEEWESLGRSGSPSEVSGSPSEVHGIPRRCMGSLGGAWDPSEVHGS